MLLVDNWHAWCMAFKMPWHACRVALLHAAVETAATLHGRSLALKGRTHPHPECIAH